MNTCNGARTQVSFPRPIENMANRTKKKTLKINDENLHIAFAYSALWIILHYIFEFPTKMPFLVTKKKTHF